MTGADGNSTSSHADAPRDRAETAALERGPHARGVRLFRLAPAADERLPSASGSHRAGFAEHAIALPDGARLELRIDQGFEQIAGWPGGVDRLLLLLQEAARERAARGAALGVCARPLWVGIADAASHLVLVSNSPDRIELGSCAALACANLGVRESGILLDALLYAAIGAWFGIEAGLDPRVAWLADFVRQAGPDAAACCGRIASGLGIVDPPTAAELVAARDRAWLDMLATDAADGARAERWSRRSGDFALAVALQERFPVLHSAAARERYVRAHREIGKNGLVSARGRALNAIRRNTHERRLEDVDAWIEALLTALHSGRHSYFGLDLDALRSAVGDGPICIHDQAVSDGTTTFELAERLFRAGEDTVGRVALIGTDIDLDYYLVPIEHDDCAVIDAGGRVVQLRIGGEVASPEDQPALASGACARFAALGAEARERCLRRWINPRAAEFARAHAGRLGYARHDVFTSFPRPTAIGRIFGLLYTQIHASADSPSYFDHLHIEDALRSAGRSLLPGGFLIAGSVVDGASVSPFVDYDVLQCERGGVGDRLVFRLRVGAGLGCAREPIALGPPPL